MIADPFGTAGLREAARAAWSSSPTRLREDANLESDHARTHYRDRVVVELAQNAADAAARAAVPGRLLVRLRAVQDGAFELIAANTGALLDTAGVRSLASLRASAKGARAVPGAMTVGRFGVGFAAVRSVADDVAIGAGDRAVRFSLARAADEIADLAGVGGLARSRGRDLPVLRLPYPGQVDVPAGYDTAVVLRLRDEEAVGAVRAQLEAIDDALALSLPALVEIVVEVEAAPRARALTRRIADVEERWHVERRSGVVDPALVEDRPVEDRPVAWSLAWALPRGAAELDGAAELEGLAHRYLAPTPTDEPCGFPAILVATFPLDPSRRHVVPCPLTDLIVGEAGRAYADLLADRARVGAPALDFVPTGLPAGVLDAALRSVALDALRSTPILPGPPGMTSVAPVDAVLVDGAMGQDPAVGAALPVPGLVLVGRGHAAVAEALGAHRVTPADAVGEAGVLGPDAVRALCDALVAHASDPAVLDAVSVLAIPLAGGGIARGPRGLLLPGASREVGAALAAIPGLRVVAAGAAHPLLERAGAVPADGPRAAELLRDVVADLAAAADDGSGPERGMFDAVMRVAQAVTGAGHELPFWWGELPLPTGVGDVAARECVLPGSWAEAVFDGLEPVAEDTVEAYGADAIAALGAVRDLTVWTVADVVTGDDAALDPAGPASWLAHWTDYLEYLADALGPGVLVGDVPAIADLDAVARDARGPFLTRVALTPHTRAALLDRVRPLAGGHGGDAASYAAWWLREELGAPFAATPAVPFLPTVPEELAGLDAAVARALGVVSDLDELDGDAWAGLADAFPPTGADVSAADAAHVWRALPVAAGRYGARLGRVGLDRLPAVHAGNVRMTQTSDLVAAVTPMWAPLRAVLPVPTAAAQVAHWLDVDLTPPGPAPDGAGQRREVDPIVARIAGVTHWWAHADLRIDGTAVEWWVEEAVDGVRVHVHGTTAQPAALPEALAAATGAYGRRHLLVAMLRDPGSAERWAVEFAWDGALS